MRWTVLYPEDNYADDSVERRIYGPDVRILVRGTKLLAELSDEDCAAADGLMICASASPPPIWPASQASRGLRMGVGYDGIDRKAAAERQVMVCNMPDYGTTEVADHAMALVLAFRRGFSCTMSGSGKPCGALAGHVPSDDPAMLRADVRDHGFGSIGTAVALRAKAFGFRVVFFDHIARTGPIARWASDARRPWKTCCARPTRCRCTRR